MRRLVYLVMLGLLGFGAWQFAKRFEIRGIDGVAIVPRSASARAGGNAVPPPKTGDTIRVATFNLQVFGRTKVEKPEVVEVLAKIVRQFDVVAVQEIQSRDQDLLPKFIEIVNLPGRHYDYVIGPRLPATEPETNRQQYAFLFDRGSLEVDRTQLYTIDDPDDLLRREPLVAWFRVRGPSPDQAFTFSLINVHVDPDHETFELEQLGQVYKVVLRDGRGEDDVIMLGDFHADDRQLARLARAGGLELAISGAPTTTQGAGQYDNIIFQQLATAEFTGRAGVFDFMREYNLTGDQATAVSDHLPVWAEFAVQEGGKRGMVAGRGPTNR